MASSALAGENKLQSAQLKAGRSGRNNCRNRVREDDPEGGQQAWKCTGGGRHES